MVIHAGKSLLQSSIGYQIIPLVESRLQLVQALASMRGETILLRHCNVFDFASLTDSARKNGISVYVSLDYIDGINADEAGLHYLAEHLRVQGIISHHPKVLALGKHLGLRTIQRIFAIDSSGLETALEAVDIQTTDLLAIEPALVIPHIAAYLKATLPLPFVGSGLLTTQAQVQAVLRAGATGIIVAKPDLWSL